MRMLGPTIVMVVIAVILLTIGYLRGHNEHLGGLQSAGTMMLQILPLLVAALVVAGMVQALVPQAFLAKWIGESSGLRGILIGSLAGGLTPGGPFVCLPLAAGLVRSGAGIGTTVAFLTGWSLWAVNRIPMEVGIIGWRLSVARLVSVLLFPPLAGLIAYWFFDRGGGV